MGELFKRSQNTLWKRRDNILNGYINSIPTPFRRFKEDFVGIEQGTYMAITSFTKGT